MGTAIGKNTYDKNIGKNESIDVNFNLNQKLDRQKLPQTVSKEEIMQMLKQYFESDTFKRMIYEFIIQKEKELERRPWFLMKKNNINLFINKPKIDG